MPPNLNSQPRNENWRSNLSLMNLMDLSPIAPKFIVPLPSKLTFPCTLEE